MRRLLPFFLIIILILLLSLSFFWIYEAKVFISRADQLRGPFSPETSYTFVTPLRVSANCPEGVALESIRVYTIVLDDSGLPVSGKRVLLEPNVNIQIQSVQGLTDEFGKAVTDVSSCKPGEYSQRVSVDGVELPQTVRMVFE